ncbi:hypothetical protein [Streptomyces sp. NPDC050738]|uniref:hypothetical protein n=1 Tax=Streptomyces sp. NPDC050738 TaxID=3154744 RepID=UPI00342701D2
MSNDKDRRGRRPAVFPFRPHTFTAVTPERLTEWEESLSTRYGLPGARLAGAEGKIMLESATWSNSGDGEICADDSDYYEFADEGAGSRTEGTSQRRPVVFTWQPTSFDPIGPDQLMEWERITREHVGLPALQLGADASSGTLSATLPNDCMDDSDYEAPE